MKLVKESFWRVGVRLDQMLSSPGAGSYARAVAAVLITGVSLAAGPAHAQGISGVLAGWSDAMRSLIDFLVLMSLVLGVGAILWGLKLIVDKSNERNDVKNLHIVVSLVGGALLCVLWLVITILVETTGGSASDIGRAAAY